VNLRTARAFVQSHGFARQDEVSLEELLGLTGNCHASDPLDYVFGIIGLVPGQHVSSAHNHGLRLYKLSPDYTLTPYELLTRLNHYLGFVGFEFAGITMLDKMLNWTASIGHIQLAKLLLDSHQVDLATEGPLVLCYAAEYGRVGMLKMLLDDFHLDANSRGRSGRTSLSWAAAGAQTEIVSLLINDYHVDLSATDNFGRTPLSWAAGSRGLAVHKILDTVKIFLGTSQVDLDSEDYRGRTPLAWAVYAGYKPVVELLLDTGKTNPSRQFDGHPLVAWAFEMGRLGVADLLIDRVFPEWTIKHEWAWRDFVASGQAGRFDSDFWSDIPPSELDLPPYTRTM
jgi:hypothetical protein